MNACVMSSSVCLHPGEHPAQRVAPRPPAAPGLARLHESGLPRRHTGVCVCVCVCVCLCATHTIMYMQV